MNSKFVRGSLGAAFLLMAWQGGAQAVVSNPSLKFEQVFSARQEPASLYYKASYQDSRGKHELEVWRDGQARLRRRTDAKLDLYATAQRDGDLSISVLDHTRQVRTDVSRSSLYQLGRFSDWFGLAHGVNKPLRPYVLQRLSEAPVKQEASFKCQWYRMEVDGQASSICWSQEYRLPVLIANAQGEVRWQITEIDRHVSLKTVFQIEDKGYAHVNADEDIKAD
ncbi:hypothetical protein [Uliginosibacterium gangwonense]|uniref:hypothetical protein n=1 Tax=Uliginosibacterium gangwonense TaxID=392736 RepID=UPI00035CE666|nr:hypothetical protein [Uliginosibacterium gangwonense]